MRSGKLPEGFYTFTVEVIEYNRNVVVSNPGIANAWIVLNDPPIINMPFNGQKVRASDPQNIMFSWTPRHTASPNAVFTTEYEFRLVEMYPGQTNPDVAIRSSNSIYTTTTTQTSLNYGIMEPTLIPGKKYAYRIRAYDTSDRDLFKNSGYSGTHMFQFGDACILPASIEGESLDANRIKVLWEAEQGHTGFVVQYRKEGARDWYEETNYLTSQVIPGLQPNTTYEYRVQGKCNSIPGDFSPVYTITTPEATEGSSDYVCGAEAPAFDMNPNPLVKPLLPLDVIKVSDWDVNIKTIQSNGDGSYRGTGYAAVPYLNLANVRVTFDRILVNEDYRVIAGSIRTVYSENSKFVADLTEEEGGLDEEGDSEEGEEEGNEGDEEAGNTDFPAYDGDYNFSDSTTVAGEFTNITENEDGTVTVTTSGGSEETITPDENGDVLVTDDARKCICGG